MKKQRKNTRILGEFYQEIAKEWHYEKNGHITPNDVASRSHRIVWWKCDVGHEWESSIRNRVNGAKCPYCSGRLIKDKNSLGVLNPKIAKEWHPTLNSITPLDVLPYSRKKVWWICSKGHEWEEQIGYRNQGSSCPHCSDKVTENELSLFSLRPDLAREWHPTKNGDLTSKDLTCGSQKKIWWKCFKGHEWEAIVKSRCKGTGCPHCSKYLRTSFPEQSIYYYMKKLFPNSLNGYIYPNSRLELDVFIPEINLGIEYDGSYFHKNKEWKKGMVERFKNWSRI